MIHLKEKYVVLGEDVGVRLLEYEEEGLVV